jgi:hypothetical protein
MYKKFYLNAYLIVFHFYFMLGREKQYLLLIKIFPLLLTYSALTPSKS